MSLTKATQAVVDTNVDAKTLEGRSLSSTSAANAVVRARPDGKIDPSFMPADYGLSVGIPPGGIIMWSGAADAIPSGWALCDGNGGTPDLRDRFVLGAGRDFPVGAVAGQRDVTLTVAQMPSHGHSPSTGESSGVHSHQYLGHTMLRRHDIPEHASGLNYLTGTQQRTTETGGGHTHGVTVGATGGGQSHPNMPPYYALCFIMKL
jgi:microcystin-dependent protein